MFPDHTLRMLQSDILQLFLQKSKEEATNFDAEFTKEDPVLTPINQDIVKTINQVKIWIKIRYGFYC